MCFSMLMAFEVSQLFFSKSVRFSIIHLCQPDRLNQVSCFSPFFPPWTQNIRSASDFTFSFSLAFHREYRRKRRRSSTVQHCWAAADVLAQPHWGLCCQPRHPLPAAGSGPSVTERGARAARYKPECVGADGGWTGERKQLRMKELQA